MRTIRIGSRDSALAVRQAELVMAAIRQHHPDLHLELVTMKTTGDRILDKTLELIGGKGLFVKELDEALHAGHVDICVHSYKDLPVPTDPTLPVVAVSRRENPRDVLILPKGARTITMEKPLGSSSLRRQTQLASLYPQWRCVAVRGNIQTRLGKLDDGGYGGLVLAAAGIKRLGLWDRVGREFSAAEMIPAACQGILAIQGRAGEDHDYLRCVNDPESRDASVAERAFIETLDGGCSAPTAAYAEIHGNTIRLSGLFVGADGVVRRDALDGNRDKAAELGRTLAAIVKGGVR